MRSAKLRIHLCRAQTAAWAHGRASKVGELDDNIALDSKSRMYVKRIMKYLGLQLTHPQ